MNKKLNLKRILFNCVLILCSIFFGYLSMVHITTIKLFKNTNNDNAKFNIIVTGEKNVNSDGYEVRLLGIKVNGDTIPLEDLQNDKGFQYVDGMLVGYYGEFELDIPKKSELSIEFLKHSWSGIITVINEQEENVNTIDLYSPNNDVEKYTYIWNSREIWEESTSLSAMLKPDTFLLFFTFSLIMLLCISCTLHFYKKIKNKNIKWYQYIIIAASQFVILMFTFYPAYKLWGKIIILAPILFIGILFYGLWQILKEKPQYIFGIIYVNFALIMIFLLPPGHVPDEYAHFIKAYEASIIGDSHTTLREGFEMQGKVYIYLPISMQSLQIYTGSVSSYNISYDIDSYYNCFAENMNPDIVSKDMFWFGNTAGLNISSYIPAILVCFILNLFNASPIVYILLIRVVHMCIVMVFGFAAIKIIPKYKHLLLVIMLLPITIQQSIGINQDWITNALCFLIISLVIDEIIDKKKCTLNRMILLTVLSILLGFVKIGYFAVLLLVFLIPRYKFNSKKEEILCKAIIILPCIILSGIQYFESATTIVSDGELPYYTLNYILEHPIKTVQIYINTLLEYGSYHFNGGLVTGFGWYTHYDRNFISFIEGVILVFVLVLGINNNYTNKKIQIVSFIAFVIASTFLYTSLFLGWTTIDSNIVSGLQPRYFIIPLLLLAISLQNSKMMIRVNNCYGIISTYLLCMLTCSAYTLADFIVI